MINKNNISAIGRRKSSIARVHLVKGKGNIFINKKKDTLLDYFKRESLVMELKEPLALVDFDNKYDFLVNIKGGGLTAQARALRLAISRTLEKINPELRAILKKAGMLTRDARVVERKKYGQPGARKKFQFSKR
tara:strand:+ start:277 stop:678 length:402 start_codon:yes stop_codon:yes gene_type:complete